MSNKTYYIDGRPVKDVNCSLCSGNNIEVLFSKHQFDWVRCKNCGMVWVNPQLLPESISEIYEKIYPTKSAICGGDIVRGISKEHCKLLLGLKKMNLGNRGKILDIGCFEGYFLNSARLLGWEVYGTEISKPAVQVANKYFNLDVRLGSILDLDFPDNCMDVVTLIDVLEHLPDPKNCLAKINKMLKSKGILYIWTPNFNSFTRKFLLGADWGGVIFPWHLHYFTSRTLKRLLNATGFEVKELATYNLLYSRFDPYLALQNPEKYIPTGRKRRHKKIFWAVVDKAFSIVSGSLSKLGFHIGGQMEVFAQKEAGR